MKIGKIIVFVNSYNYKNQSRVFFIMRDIHD